jgi:hypothetical protein
MVMIFVSPFKKKNCVWTDLCYACFKKYWVYSPNKIRQNLKLKIRHHLVLTVEICGAMPLLLNIPSFCKQQQKQLFFLKMKQDPSSHTVICISSIFIYVNKNWGNTNNSVKTDLVSFKIIYTHTGWREWKTTTLQKITCLSKTDAKSCKVKKCSDKTMMRRAFVTQNATTWNLKETTCVNV